MTKHDSHSLFNPSSVDFGRILVAILVFAGVLTSAGAQTAAGNLGNVWCLGDSWTDCWERKTWRRHLWQGLSVRGWTANFVGTLTTDSRCESGQAFDRDHNGIAGITARELLDLRLASWLAQLTPDTVLSLLGGNDENF